MNEEHNLYDPVNMPKVSGGYPKTSTARMGIAFLGVMLMLPGLAYLYMQGEIKENSMVMWLVLTVVIVAGVGKWILSSSLKGRELEPLDTNQPMLELQPENIWICPKCQEKVEDNFSLCWNCSSPREEESQDSTSLVVLNK